MTEPHLPSQLSWLVSHLKKKSHAWIDLASCLTRRGLSEGEEERLGDKHDERSESLSSLLPSFNLPAGNEISPLSWGVVVVVGVGGLFGPLSV